jgi:hypothetical protein
MVTKVINRFHGVTIWHRLKIAWWVIRWKGFVAVREGDTFHAEPFTPLSLVVHSEEP